MRHHYALTRKKAQAVLEARERWPGISIRQLAHNARTSPGTIRNVLAGYPPYGTNKRPKRTDVSTAADVIDSAA